MEDFHIHTTYSDGFDNVEQILDKTQNFSMFSVTDHNTIEACKKIHKPNFVSGVEFSVFVHNKELHLLGYDYDVNNTLLERIISEYQYYNNEIFCNIFKKVIEKHKLKIDFQELKKLIDLKVTLNKVNLAKILLKNEIGKNIFDAYNNYIKEFCNINYFYVSIKDVLDAVKEDNGLVFWAHPFVHCLECDEIENLALKAKNIGIDGLEVTRRNFYETLNLVKKHNLLYCIGSDYHGSLFERCNEIGVDVTMFQSDENYIKNRLRR